MDSPIRQYQKQKDYLRHKLFRKIKRRKRAQAQQEAEAPLREMRRRVLKRFKDGKDIKRFDDGEDIVYESPDVPISISYVPKSNVRVNPETGGVLTRDNQEGALMLPEVEIRPKRRLELVYKSDLDLSNPISKRIQNFSRRHYWDLILGAPARLQASIDNGSNPLVALGSMFGVPDTDNMLSAVSPIGYNDINKLNLLETVFDDVINAGIKIPDKIKTKSRFYRKLTNGQLRKIIEDGGDIKPLKSEKTLTLRKGKPRSGDFYIEIDKNTVPVKEELPRAEYSPFNRAPVSARVSTNSNYSPNINDKEVKLFKSTPSGYLEVINPMNNPELRLNTLNKRGNSSYILEKQRGEEVYRDSHTILTNSPRTNLVSSDYVIDPYSFSGAQNNTVINLEGVPVGKNKYMERFSGIKDSPSLRKIYNTKMFHEDPYGHGLMSSEKALYENAPNNKYTDAVRQYISDFEGKIDPVFDNSSIMHHALLDFYKNNYGVDLIGLNWEERAKFMQALKNESQQELLFHSSSYPDFKQFDPSLLARNTGNQGFIGRGLYATDIPTNDYGWYLIPLLISEPRKQIILERTPGIRRLTSPMLDVDDILLQATIEKGNTYKFKRGLYVPAEMSSPYVGMDVGGRPELWNKWLKDNKVDLVRGAFSSKGSGIYAETLIPEFTSLKVSPLFKPLYNSGKDSGIHINPKNRGKFNALKKRTGKTTEQLTHSKNPLTRKRAIFALNARKWHHK